MIYSSSALGLIIGALLVQSIIKVQSSNGEIGLAAALCQSLKYDMAVVIVMVLYLFNHEKIDRIRQARHPFGCTDRDRCKECENGRFAPGPKS